MYLTRTETRIKIGIVMITGKQIRKHKWSPMCDLESVPEELILERAATIRRKKRNPTGRGPGAPRKMTPCGTCGEMFSAGELRGHQKLCRDLSMLQMLGGV